MDRIETIDRPGDQCPRRRSTSHPVRLRRLVAGAVLTMAVIIPACGDGDATAEATVTTTATPLAVAGDCEDRFVAADLDHETRGRGTSRSMFDGTGAGVAVGDLDGDGLDDVVLANLSGNSSLLWNRGGLTFDREPLIEGRFRHVSIVDVDGDDRRDVVLSTGIGRPLALLNTGAGTTADDRFSRVELPGVDAYTYALAWGDLGGDGDLDLVTGSYNAELTAQRRLELGDQGGVIVFENDGEGFTPTQLTDQAQSLAVRIGDLNGDRRPDIQVGNDLATPDGIWYADDDGWVPATPFSETSYSTMSLDAGDLDNDGDYEILATDMAPMDDSAQTRDAYAEVAADMAASPVVDDVQRPENVLLMPDGDEFVNRATSRGVVATGWSWSGVFGDLDNDGLADLYVVNGMVADNLFAHLPGSALVEPNQAFANRGPDGFVPMADWGLDDTASGRGMAMADLDRDGDLDIVVNNLNGPARIHENRLCGQRSLTAALRWEGTANIDAVGAEVTVVDETGARRNRRIEATRGYLSGGPTTVHVGLGPVSGPLSVEITWPDGARSVTEAEPDQHLVVTRTGREVDR